MNYSIPDCIAVHIERAIDLALAAEKTRADRDAEKADTRADIIDTMTEIIENIDGVESLAMLQRIQKDLHNLEDEIHLITGHASEDENHKPGSYWNGEKWIPAGNYRPDLKEEARYGEW